MKKIIATMAALALAGAVVAGCSKPAEKPAETKPAEAKPATPAPTSTTVSGKSADGKLEVKLVLAGKVASVELVAPNFTFAAPPAKDAKNKDGEGHAVLTLDGAADKAITASTMRTALKDLTPGKHTLVVKLHNNDKTATATEAKVEFEVK